MCVCRHTGDAKLPADCVGKLRESFVVGCRVPFHQTLSCPGEVQPAFPDDGARRRAPCAGLAACTYCVKGVPSNPPNKPQWSTCAHVRTRVSGRVSRRLCTPPTNPALPILSPLRRDAHHSPCVERPTAPARRIAAASRVRMPRAWCLCACLCACPQPESAAS